MSAEILAIALSTIANEPMSKQIMVLVVVALAITVIVYGLVALIARMDDMGSWLMQQSSSALQTIGRGLIAFTPWLMKGLSIVGTAVMFLVGGSLLVHGIAPIQSWVEQSLLPQGGAVAAIAPLLVHVVVGALIGGVIVCLVHVYKRMTGKAVAH